MNMNMNMNMGKQSIFLGKKYVNSFLIPFDDGHIYNMINLGVHMSFCTRQNVTNLPRQQILWLLQKLFCYSFIVRMFILHELFFI